MTNSVELARQFESLESELKDAPSGAVRLSLLMRMWPILGDWLQVPSAKIYIDEFRGHLRAASTQESFADLTITDHRILLKIFRELEDATSEQVCSKALLKKFAYVGAHQELISLLGEMTSETFRSEEKPTTSDSLSELRQLHQLKGSLDASCPKSAALLEKIISEWEAEIESHTAGEAWCLCVQDGPSIPIPIGSLVRLSVQLSFAGRRTDEKGTLHPDKIAFASQLRASDDPAVGGVRRALQAVRKLLTDLEYAKGNREQVWSIDIQLRDQQAALTGDSLSLAASVAAYTAILQHEVTRTERLVSSEVAFIGSISEDGQLEAVNEATLDQKLTRAFFSHLKYVVLPVAHREQADQITSRLGRDYPLRKLRLIFAEALAEVVENHNVIRPERLCPGVYVSRLAGKYATSAYVLAPFLLIVSYLLLTVVYPRAAIWFDRNPKQIKLSEDRRHLEVQNENGNTLWSLEYWPLGGFLEDGKWLLSSIDEDPFNEVILVFDVQAGDPRWLPAHIYAFDDDAGMMWNSPAVNVGEYIGDSSATNPYKTYISVCPHNENNLILSRAVESSPSRTHISLFSNDGRKIGWYINQGTVGVKVFSNQIDNSRAIIMGHGFNNRTKTGVIFSLDPDNMYGVSPPYDFIDGYDLSWLRRGSQKHYVTLERTELNKKIRKNPYNYVFQLELYENMSFTAMTQEIDSIESGLLYSFDEFFRVQNVTSDDYFIETIRQFAESGMTPFASRDSLSELQKNLVRYWTDSGWVSEQMLSLMFEQKSR